MTLKKFFLFISFASGATLSTTTQPMFRLIQLSRPLLQQPSKTYTQQAFFSTYTQQLKQLIQDFKNQNTTGFMMLRKIKEIENARAFTKQQIIRNLKNAGQSKNTSPHIRDEINLFLKLYTS